MRRAVVIAVVAAAGAGAAWGQMSPDQLVEAQLELAQKTEQWTFWMMVTGGVSALFASLSVAGLIWTFSEQRKLTQAQERAFVDLVRVSASRSSFGYVLHAEVRNTGRTHAFKIGGVAALYESAALNGVYLDENFDMRPQAEMRRRFLKIKPTIKLSFGTVDDLAPGTTQVVRAYFSRLPENIDAAIRNEDGTGVSSNCILTYLDAYGRDQILEFDCSVSVPSDKAASDLIYGRASMFGRHARGFIGEH